MSAFSVILSACLPRGQDWHFYGGANVGYLLSVPPGYTHEKDDEEGVYFGYADSTPWGHFWVQTYDSNGIKNCSSHVTGTSQTWKIPERGAETVWGKVDYFDVYWTRDFPNATPPVCTVPKNGAGYALCSEKDGKVVIVCISQRHDNEELAKQVFETFRWIK